MISAEKYLHASRLFRDMTDIVARETESQGLTPQEWLALTIVVSSDGCTFTELAHQLGVTLPLVSGYTKSLHEDGYIRIKRHRSDGRSRIAKATSKGIKAIRQLQEA